MSVQPESTACRSLDGGVGTPLEVRVCELGRVEYDAAYALQERLAAARAENLIPDVLLLLEHPPVLTLGRRGSREHIYASDELLQSHGVTVHETNRGGLVTYHGPGQVVGYVIARLAGIAANAPCFVSGLEETLIRTLAELGISAHREESHRGVWTAQGKIAAIGVSIRRGVTMHGFALNLQPDLGHFTLINPCGIGDLGVTSVERLLGAPADPTTVHPALAYHFGAVFNREMRWNPPLPEGEAGSPQADRVRDGQPTVIANLI